MVRPIRDALAKTEAQIQSIERDRIDAFATIKSQMEALASGQSLLSRETRNLVTALRRPDVRGQWGEITLRRLVELSGMSEHVDFTEQQHQSTETGAIRPDMIVHMPERRDIVVDVKTPLDAYLAAVESQTDEERAMHLRRHAQLVGARVRELSSKQYWSQFEHSPDFVVLFLPGDQFLAAALQENPGLIDESLRQNVMLATPTSLVALLKAVAYGWKQTVLADNAAEIRRLGEDLYKRLAVFGEHLGKLGKSLGNSVESFNKAVGSLEQQVLPAARRFPELGLRVSRELESIEHIDTLAREPRASDTAPSGAATDGEPPEASLGALSQPRRAAGYGALLELAILDSRQPRTLARHLRAARRVARPDGSGHRTRRGANQARLVARRNEAPGPRDSRASDQPLSRLAAPLRGSRLCAARKGRGGSRPTPRRRAARTRRGTRDP